MAGARALWVATGMKHEQFGKPIIAVVNSFTQFVPGHTHLHEIGQIVREEIEKMGCYAAEFNTIAIDDGIAMGHDGMLYSLPSRDIIADSVEYMVNAHKADAMICISNCDKVTPGMLMASMRLLRNVLFYPRQPMEYAQDNYCAADVNVNPVPKSVIYTCMPSKTATCLLSEQPTVVSMDLDSDMAKKLNTVDQWTVVAPGDAQAMADAILRVYRKGSQKSKNAAQFLAKLGPVENAKQYVRILEEATTCVVSGRN